MNLVTVALPNLIAPELVITYPMSSMSGYVNYIEYVAGVDKGEVEEGKMFNSPFALGNYDPNYTSSRVVETVTVGEGGAATLAWAPVYDGDYADAKATVVGVEGATVTVVDAKEGTITITGLPEGTTEVKVKYVYNNVVVPQNSLPTIKAEMKSMPLLAKARRIAVEKYAA